MGWRTGVLVAVLVTITALFSWNSERSAAASRYAFADSCQALGVGGSSVNRASLGGYSVGSGGGEPFYLKASGLGTYLLFDSERPYPSTPLLGNPISRAAPLLLDGERRPLSAPLLGTAIARAAQPGPATDWELQPSGDGFALTNLGN